MPARLANISHGQVGGGHEKQSGKFAGLTSQPEASKLLNVSARTIRDAKSIMKEAPEKVQAIERGEKTIHQVKREIRKTKVTRNAANTPPGKYRVIYADPPWKYGDTLSGSIGEGYGGAEKHYPAMTIAELCALPERRHAKTGSPFGEVVFSRDLAVSGITVHHQNTGQGFFSKDHLRDFGRVGVTEEKEADLVRGKEPDVAILAVGSPPLLLINFKCGKLSSLAF